MAFNISYIIEAVDKFTPIAGKISASVRKVEGSIQTLNNSLTLNKQKMADLKSQSAALQSQIIGAAAVLAAIAFPIKAAMDFEEAMANVKKVVDFDTPKQFEEMGEDIKNLSKSIPITQRGLADIVAAAGQFGVARDNLVDFTSIAARMATAFDMVPAEAGKAMAVLSNVFRLTIPEVESLGDAINYFSNNAAAAAPDLVQVLTRTGNMARAFGLAKEQAVGLAGAFLQMGIEPQRASTAMLSLLSTLRLIDKAKPNVQAAFKALGIAPKQFAAMLKNDPTKALKAVSKAYSTMDAKKIAIINKELFGEGLEASNVMTVLSSGKNFEKALDLVADKMKLAGSMQKEFAARSATTANALQLMGNKVNNIAINLGTALLPPLASILSVVGVLADGIADFAAHFPFLTKVLFGAVIGLAALRLAMVVSSFLFVNLKIAALSLYGVMLALPKVLALARTAVLLFNVAIAANPIGVMVGSALALGALLYALIANLDSVKAALASLYNMAVKVGSVIGDSFSSIFSGAASLIGFETPPTATAAVNENINYATQNIQSSSTSQIDINLKGDTQMVQGVKTKTDGDSTVNVTQNMAYGAY